MPCQRAWTKLAATVQTAAAIKAPTGRLLTLSLQRPGNSPRRWYWKVAVELFTHEPAAAAIELTAVDGGRFAVYRLVGPQEGIGSAARPRPGSLAWSDVQSVIRADHAHPGQSVRVPQRQSTGGKAEQ